MVTEAVLLCKWNSLPFCFFYSQHCSSTWQILMLKGRIMFMFTGLWAPQDPTVASAQLTWV